MSQDPILSVTYSRCERDVQTSQLAAGAQSQTPPIFLHIGRAYLTAFRAACEALGDSVTNETSFNQHKQFYPSTCLTTANKSSLA